MSESREASLLTLNSCQSLSTFICDNMDTNSPLHYLHLLHTKPRHPQALTSDLLSSGNCLSSLPSTLGDLTSLVDLEAAGNQLTSVPDQLYKLKSLKKLALFGNRLTDLPDGIEVWMHGLGRAEGIQLSLTAVIHHDLLSLMRKHFLQPSLPLRA